MFADELALAAARILITAAVVVGASVAAERVGPLIGGVIISLPVVAGPGYVFLAMSASDAFVAESALASLAVFMATCIFLAVFALLAPRLPALASLTAAFAAWVALAYVVRVVPWTWQSALLGNAVTLAVCLGLVRRARRVSPPVIARRRTRGDLALRAVLAGGLVALVVGISELVGPRVTGILVVMPIAYTSLAWILHRRYGGAMAAATMAASLVGMSGLVLALLALHLLAVPLGTWPALTVALGVSLLVSTAIVVIGRSRALR